MPVLFKKTLRTGSYGAANPSLFTRPFQDPPMNNRKGRGTGYCALTVPRPSLIIARPFLYYFAENPYHCPSFSSIHGLIMKRTGDGQVWLEPVPRPFHVSRLAL